MRVIVSGASSPIISMKRGRCRRRATISAGISATISSTSFRTVSYTHLDVYKRQIPDKAAVALARHFYRYLAAGQPVDAALTSARAFLYARGFAVEWGAPALHMRTPDGRLFDLAAAPRTPAVARMAPADEPQSAAAPPQSPPTSVTLSQPVSDEGSKRRNALAAIVGIALLGTAALWFTASKESTPEADQLPGPPVLGAPAPMPALPAPIQARPIDQAMARLLSLIHI